MENICAIWSHGELTNSCDSNGHKLCPADNVFFLNCNEGHFMSHLHISKQYNPQTTLMIPLDILTIYSPLMTLNLGNIFPRYVKQNISWIKQILQTKKLLSWTSIVGSDVHTRVYDKCDDIRLFIVDFPRLSGPWDVPRFKLCDMYFLQLVRFACCCISVLGFNCHSKKLQITSNLSIQEYIYHKLRKHLESSSGHTRNFRPNLVKYRFKNMFLKGSAIQSSTVI